MTLWSPPVSPLFGQFDLSIRPKHPATSPMAPIRPCLQDLRLASLGLQQPILNPKFGKLFKLVGAGFPGKGTEAYELAGRTIVEGFTRLGFKTIGTGAVGWFNPDVPTGRHLSEHFERFFYPGNSYSLDRQLEFIANELRRSGW